MKRKEENAQIGHKFNMPLREAGNKTRACDDTTPHANAHSKLKKQRILPNLHHHIARASPDIPMACETWNQEHDGEGDHNPRKNR
jgi:hypothetical protein